MNNGRRDDAEQAEAQRPAKWTFDFFKIANQTTKAGGRAAGWTLSALNDFHGLLTATATVLLVWIAFWQWEALDSTDRTITRAMTNGQAPISFLKMLRLCVADPFPRESGTVEPANGQGLADVTSIRSDNALSVLRFLE
jgi:hypothetical protein